MSPDTLHSPSSDALPQGRRPVYRRADLLKLLEPQSIAVVGASARAGSFGERTARNLAQFSGRLHLVNPRYDRIGDAPCHASVAALPEVPDLVVAATPMEACEDVVRDCVAAGVGALVLYAAGFAETGRPERVALQQRIVGMARQGGLRLLGPNCIGLTDYVRRAEISFVAIPRPQAPPTRPALCIVSQSGNLGFALAQSVEAGAQVSRVLTCGNSGDIDVADLVAALGEDPGCSAIALLFEGMADPSRLIEAAAIARRKGKPVVVHKLGTGEQGAQAAMSHTGSLAGSNEVYRAAFERAGMVLSESFEGLLELASFLAKAGRPRAPGVAVVSTSGGAAIMAADRAEAHGVSLPQPGPDAQAVLSARIPEFGSARNPCDVTAQVLNDPGSLQDCMEALLADPAYGALLLPNGFAYDVSTPRFHLLDELAARHGKVGCVVWTTQWLEGPGAREVENTERVAMFRSMDRCMAAIAAWHRQGARGEVEARAPARLSPPGARDAAARLLDQASGPVLTEREAKAVLAAYGIPVVQEILSENAEAAVSAAEAVGYPVVLKVESPALPHKTEAGVIRLNLPDAASVRDAFAEVMRNAHRAAPGEPINGVLVQPMVPPGIEMVVGARRDPLFGATVLVGLGGILVELMRDSVVALAPVGAGEARGMLGRLKGERLLSGFRNLPEVDRDMLAGIIQRVSELAADHADRIAEIDVNPVICAGSRQIAVDALIALSPAAPHG
ncbi:acetate--CoA ligase family protein [Roseomonas sp. SSH11]|uniref:Acetate--CoA ligase family protein n=1 Tax=Pararoseomonas baculiformis TaxID=2820812 RepID=A0ABS4A9X6_9PROT|nr:acetate--CoA ligase family protein [Pararoseomonas baculiformis]MBP0443811.1 acetate--CoA ligase family protein [Pararoseomonas baculiformis]